MSDLITHDLFGRDVYDKQFQFIGGSRDEANAFLLGCQGPDPLFFAALTPKFANFRSVGSAMHSRKPSELINNFKQSLSILPSEEKSVGRAYALGFVCHYLLDTTVHPFIYAQEYALCDAGEPGLDRSNANEVHAYIERELDELLLFTHRGETVATFNPSKQILKATDQTLAIVSKLYAYVLLSTYGQMVPENLFARSVHNYRLVQRTLYSPRGIKRALLGTMEQLIRPYSMVLAFTPQAVERTSSIFANSENAPWTNPYTFETSTASFEDLYEEALTKALAATVAFDKASFDLEDARKLTEEKDFSGTPVVAILTHVEDAVPAGNAGANPDTAPNSTSADTVAAADTFADTDATPTPGTTH